MDEQGRRAELLLAGPRGRAVCLCIAGVSPLTYLTQRGGDDGFFANEDRYDQAVVSGVVEALEAVPADGLRITNQTVTAAVAETAGCAAYWQEPDANDVLLADPQVIQGLRPIASALAASEATSWWGDPLRLDDQFFVSWLFQAKQTRADPPLLTGAAERRFRWRVHAKQEELEAARERPSDLEARYTGSWWSTPVLSGLVSTTPRLANGTPAQLVFIEDEEGMTQARVARLQPAPDVRIYEITDPPDLVELVSRYPLHTDHARRHDWYRTTGCRGPWLIPDWDTIGSSYDAVHLTVLDYLATAGRAIPSAATTPCWPAGTPARPGGSTTSSPRLKSPPRGSSTHRPAGNQLPSIPRRDPHSQLRVLLRHPFGIAECQRLRPCSNSSSSCRSCWSTALCS